MNQSVLKRLPKAKLLTLINDLEMERDALAMAYDNELRVVVDLKKELAALKVVQSVSGDSLAPVVWDCSGSAEHLSRVVKENHKKTKAQLLCMIAYKEALLDFDKSAKVSGAARAEQLEGDIKKLQEGIKAETSRADKNYKAWTDMTARFELARAARTKAMDAVQQMLLYIADPEPTDGLKPLLKTIANAL